MWVSAWVSTPPVISRSGVVFPTMMLHRPLIDGMGRNSRSGGQHSDEARPSSYQVTHRPAGARPQSATVLVEGTKPA